MPRLKIIALYLLLPFSIAIISVPFIYHEIEFTRISQRVFNDSRAKIKVGCGTGNDVAVILVFGQSNSSNEGDGRFSAGDNVLNFNYIDGNCYLAKDPLLGTSGTGGSFLSRLGNSLASRGKYERVILVPLSVGASYIVDWAPNGQFHERLNIAAAKLKEQKLSVSHILLHLGEADAGAGTAPKVYERKFYEIVDSLRKLEIHSPIYVAVATLCGGSSSERIRAVQKSLPDSSLGIYPGPDTDTIGLEMRFDGCHMKATGLDRHAEMWYEVITRLGEE